MKSRLADVCQAAPKASEGANPHHKEPQRIGATPNSGRAGKGIVVLVRRAVLLEP